MRMWLVNPQVLCRQHLLGEHVEMHMFAGVIKKQTSLDGYITNGLVETDKIQARHDALAAEMEKRGYNHASPMVCPPVATEGKIDAEANLRELARRCPDCATLQNRMGP